MNSFNQGLIIDKKYDEAAHRREQEKQKKIEKISRETQNQQAAKSRREELEEIRRKELEEQLKAKREKEERIVEEKAKQIQIRSNKNLEHQKKLKQIAEIQEKQTQQLRQEYEQKMETATARKILSLETKRSKAKEELNKVQEVIKRKESPVSDIVHTWPTTPTSTTISSPTTTEPDEVKRPNKKKVKKLRQKILSLKKKLDAEGAPSPLDKKYKNPKLKKAIQELQAQYSTNNVKVPMLQDLTKMFTKLPANDYEFIKQEGCIEVLVQICTAETTKELYAVREASYKVLLLLTPENTTYLMTSTLILPLINSLAEVIVTDAPYVNEILQVIGNAMGERQKYTQLREEIINYIIVLGIHDDLITLMRSNPNVTQLKLLDITTQSPKSPHRDNNLFGLVPMLTAELLDSSTRKDQIGNVTENTLQFACEVIRVCCFDDETYDLDS
jgi:chemotaxis protein histidine kinase CheA